MRLHGMAMSIVEVADVRVVIIRDLSMWEEVP